MDLVVVQQFPLPCNVFNIPQENWNNIINGTEPDDELLSLIMNGVAL
jgi:hypothetical protein